jgi:drug/metabolite transporter (DMT)-like permease
VTTTAPPARPATASAAAIWLALVTVYVVWGSTYLGIRVVVDTMPPLVSMSVRFLAAAALLGAVLAARHGIGVLGVTRREAGAAAIVGLLLLLCGNGAVAVAEQTVPSGLAALLVSATPLWLVLLRTGTGDRPRVATLGGTALGFGGIALLALPGSRTGDVQTWGVLLIIAATVCWAVGSFSASRLPLPANPFVATVWEMFAGGAAMLVIGVGRGELRGFTFGQVAPEGWLALGYLTVFGSLVAFTAYVWLLHNAPISLTATYAYVNPVVAVILGFLILAEPVTGVILAGGAIVVVGVALVVRSERPRAPERQPARRGPKNDAFPEKEVIG